MASSASSDAEAEAEKNKQAKTEQLAAKGGRVRLNVIPDLLAEALKPIKRRKNRPSTNPARNPTSGVHQPACFEWSIICGSMDGSHELSAGKG